MEPDPAASMAFPPSEELKSSAQLPEEGQYFTLSSSGPTPEDGEQVASPIGGQMFLLSIQTKL